MCYNGPWEVLQTEVMCYHGDFGRCYEHRYVSPWTLGGVMDQGNVLP